MYMGTRKWGGLGSAKLGNHVPYLIAANPIYNPPNFPVAWPFLVMHSGQATGETK
jgi:hypothetical protein